MKLTLVYSATAPSISNPPLVSQNLTLCGKTSFFGKILHISPDPVTPNQYEAKVELTMRPLKS